MSIFRRSGVYLIANILNALVPFLLLPILTRYFTTSEYGQVAMFQTLVTGLTALVGVNTIGAANRKYYDNEHNSLAEYNGTCLQILFGSLFLLGVIVVVLSQHLVAWLYVDNDWILLALVVSGANFIIMFRLGQWQVREQAIKFGIMQVSQSMVNFLFSIALIVFWKMGAEGRIQAIVFTGCAYALISLILLYKDKLVSLFSFRKDYILDALKFGIPLVPHVIGIFFLSSLDRFVINKELGISEAGIYMFAVQLSLGVAVVFDSINKAMITWLFKSLADSQTKQLQRLVKMTYLFFVVVFLLGCLSFIIGPIVVRIIGGDKFEQASNIIGWLCLGQCFGGMYLMVTNYLFYAKKTGRLSIVTVISAILNVVLLLCLIRVNGIVGVSMAFCISMCFRFLSTWWLTSQLKLVSWNIFKKTELY